MEPVVYLLRVDRGCWVIAACRGADKKLFVEFYDHCPEGFTRQSGTRERLGKPTCISEPMNTVKAAILSEWLKRVFPRPNPEFDRPNKLYWEIAQDLESLSDMRLVG